MIYNHQIEKKCELPRYHNFASANYRVYQSKGSMPMDTFKDKRRIWKGKKIICIEGPDNIGKTMLANYIANEYHASRFHLGAPKKKGEEALKEQIQTLNDVLDRCKEPDYEVWDRSVIGEAVYGPLFRSYDHSEYWHSLLRLRKFEKKILFIVMYADESTYKRWRIEAKADEIKEYQKQAMAKTVSVKFIDIATKLGLANTLYINCNNYDSMNHRNAYICKRIEKFMKSVEYQYEKTDDYTRTFFNHNDRIWSPGIGFIRAAIKSADNCKSFHNATCKIGQHFGKLKMYNGEDATPVPAVGSIGSEVKYIFVGESTGYNEDGPQLGMPFYNGKSGQLFQYALDQCGIHPTHYYLTNVVKCNPKDNKLGNYVNKQNRDKLECVSMLVDEIALVKSISWKKIKVIAIGKVASEELERLDIEHAMIYHPSYYLRLGNGYLFPSSLMAMRVK